MSRARKLRQTPRPAPLPDAALVSRSTLLLGLAAAAVYATFFLNPGLLWYVGIQHYDFWFADTFALLASGDAVAQGLNPYGPNPLDIFGRPHVYSHWWLALRHLGLTRADIHWLGPTVVIGFWCVALRGLRPRGGRQWLYSLLVLVAPPVLLACDRGNNDLIIFLLLTPLAFCLQHRSPWVRGLAPPLIALASGLKYYPAIAGLTLLATAPFREVRWRLVAGVALLVFVGLSVAPDLAIFGPLAPKPSGWMTFGAISIFNQLGWTGPTPALIGAAAGVALFVWGWRSTRLDGWTASVASQGDWLHFVLGAALLAGCFFASANFAYRWIFALWLPPFLWSLAEDTAAPGPARRLATVTRWLLLGVLWLDTIYSWIIIAGRGLAPPETLRLWIKWSFVAEQPLTWGFFACLLVFLARFTRDGLRAATGRDSAAA